MGRDFEFDSEHQQALSGSAKSEEFAALAARVTALEQQVATLRATLSPQGESVTNQQYPAEAAEVAPPPPKPTTSAAAQIFAHSAAAPANPRSLEDRLGSQIFSRVGIVALLIGVTWFMKLAIDNQWIGPTGRILAGLIAGAGLVVWSERFRNRGFSAFSYSLKAVGSGVLYLSLWAAFQIYHLLPESVALAAMLLVTAWNAYMAWAQNAQLLAAYALIGGCATPLLLSTGGNHESFLFTYLLAMDVAAIVLVRLRPWPRLLIGVFPATVAYFIGWYVQFYSADQLGLTSVFIALFFLSFAGVPLLASRKPQSQSPTSPHPSIITEILLPLANAVFASLAFYAVLQSSGYHGWLPWMVLLFSAAYLAIMRLPQSTAASAVHLSLAIVFLTIAIPLKISGRWITVSWLVEGAALLWVAARLASARSTRDDSPADAYRVLRALSIVALLLGLAGLLLPAYGFDLSEVAFLNRRFATALVGIAAFSIACWIALHVRQSEPPSSPAALPTVWSRIAGGSIIAINLIAIFATVHEIVALWNGTPANSEGTLQQALAISAFLMLYGAALLAVGFWKRTAFIRWQALLLIVYTIAKTFLYDMRNLSQGYRVASFMALGALLLAVSFAYQKDWLALKDSIPAEVPTEDRP
ncbi:DUF2339 domain-containing protein [Granulicella sp. dw_53]|uniref:DUF2339 domain-containing protein n=1 Tax=Granulicella sp. dw_53 TaxID=2719792 RepID=UPI001BD5F0F0|nr:DUF2339 domain-containing protein [Granulicella sp. dw_53]